MSKSSVIIGTTMSLALCLLPLSATIAQNNVQLLEYLPGGDVSWAYGISNDNTAVGVSNLMDGGVMMFQPVQMKYGDPRPTVIGAPNGLANNTSALDITDDGLGNDVIIGSIEKSSLEHIAFCWTKGSYNKLPHEPGYTSFQATRIGAKGKTIVGAAKYEAKYLRPVFWRLVAGKYEMHALGNKTGKVGIEAIGEGRAWNVSSDGNWVVGSYNFGLGKGDQPVYWDLTSFVPGTPPSATMLLDEKFSGDAFAVSGDGNFVVARSSGGNQSYRVKRGTAESISLDCFGAEDMSDDGNIIVGGSKIWQGGTVKDFRTYILKSLPPEAAPGKQNWEIGRVYSVSPNGKSFAGYINRTLPGDKSPKVGFFVTPTP